MNNIFQRAALELERLRRYNLVTEHPLQQLFWESTLRCNLHCLHCGSDCKSSLENTEMPAADFLHVLDTEITPHVDTHQLMIIISGGEPLMRHDLAEIGRELYKREYPWGIVTNGLVLTKERFDELIYAGLRSITVSLDGLEKEHNNFRQHSLAFQNAKRAIQLIAQHNTEHPNLSVLWDVVTCVQPATLPQLHDLREELWSWGCRRWRLTAIDPMGRATGNLQLQLDKQEFQNLLKFIASERQTGRRVSYGCAGFLGEWEGKVRNHLYHCAAGVSVASILYDGSISACTSIRGKYYQGNIYKDSFWQVWSDRFQKYRNRGWMQKKEPCNDCKMFRYCEGNGMHLRSEDGSLLKCHYKDLI